jgi:hypothetical protein
MADRPAPLVLVALPRDDAPFGTHAAIAADGRRALAADLSHRLGALGAAVVALPFQPPHAGEEFAWGTWFAAAAREALDAAPGAVDAIGYVGGGALPLLADSALDALLSPIPGEVVANNRFSADAFVVAGDVGRALAALEACATDNAAPRAMLAAGFAWRDLGTTPWARFDVDTTLDLALLRLATRLADQRQQHPAVAGFLEMARLPGNRPLEVPHLDAIGTVMRDRNAELVVAGRLAASTWAELETETACRVRAFVEERGMRSAPGSSLPRSILAGHMRATSPTALVEELATLGDAVVMDTRVLMAAVAGSAHDSAWPPEEERFASDFGDVTRIETAWLRELTAAAVGAPVPFLMGGHALVSDGLRLIMAAAWQGR